MSPTNFNNTQELSSAPLFQSWAIAALKFYQKALSWDHYWRFIFGGMRVCRYYPTCSEYTLRAIQHRGVSRGIIAGAWRILRCNPWSNGGVDDPR